MKRILFVDDESNVLSGIKRHVKVMQDEWHVSFATSAKQALEIIALKPVDVLVTDIRMPGMNGVELIQKVQESYPSTIPIAVSGYCSTSDAVSLLKSGIRFFSKPCDIEKLVSLIRHVLRLQSS